MIPLVLDLDGTIVASDTLIECALRLLASNPLALLRALPLALTNRAAFKHRLATLAHLSPATLPYNQAVLDLAQTARAEGRQIYLATAADSRMAQAVGDHLAIFDGVIASDGQTNLKAETKAQALVARFGRAGFDYAGDTTADLPVWAQARRAIVIAPSPALLAQATRANPNLETLGARLSWPARARLLARALRLHQWAKNSLIFVPVLAAHRAQPAVLGQAAIAFLAFSLCASSVYLLNDLLDLPHDRAHATKRRRPFASGALDVRWAAALIPALLATALTAAAALPGAFLSMLAAYYVTTLAYSFVLKRRSVWDVITLAGLYTLRIFAGAAATTIPISPWLLAFSLFLFFCLAVVKRLTELTLFLRTAPVRATLSGRGYGAEDLDMLRSMAASSGYMAVLVLALYINSAEVLPLYRTPSALWVLCPILLFWISRVLMISNRGQMNDDPVIFALRDRVSLLAGLACLCAFVAASL